MSATPFDIPALLKDIENNGSNLSGNEEARQQCLASARSLSYALETPRETLLRIQYAQIPLQACLRIGVEIGLFKALDKGNGKPVSTSDLANDVGVDAQLLARFLKHLAAMGIIYEADADRFLSTPFSSALTQQVYADSFAPLQDSMDPAVYKLHEYLAKTGYKTPNNALDAPFQFAYSTKSHYFEWMQARPHLWKMFNGHMTASNAGLLNWMDPRFYPLEDNLLKDTAEDAVLIIDVGGGNGHDLQEICRKYPHVNRRMIVQDQASVIDHIADKNLDPRIQPMTHNFFEKQPVKGAKAYYLHRIMHDWNDEKSLEILLSIKSAMVKGYSKLLIYDMVIPDRGAQATSTGLDIIMMTLFGTSERTEQGWKKLLEDMAGFRILKIWPVEPASESLIEAEIA